MSRCQAEMVLWAAGVSGTGDRRELGLTVVPPQGQGADTFILPIPAIIGSGMLPKDLSSPTLWVGPAGEPRVSQREAAWGPLRAEGMWLGR